jgi:hypothetical protein
MPVQMGLAALLMSGALHSGEPARLTLDADAISQPNGGAAVILAAGSSDATAKKKGRKGGKTNPGSSKPL